MRVAPYAARQLLAEKNINITWIEQQPDDKLDVDWLGAGHHNYGHLVAMDLPLGTVTWNYLETNYPAVTPKAMFQTGPRMLLSWCMLQATDSQRDFLADEARLEAGFKATRGRL